MAQARRSEAPEPGDCHAAVLRDLAVIAKADKALSESALAAACLALALELDDPFTSATSKGICAKALSDIMGQLRELTPKSQEKDGLDELGARRAARRARGSAAPA